MNLSRSAPVSLRCGSARKIQGWLRGSASSALRTSMVRSRSRAIRSIRLVARRASRVDSVARAPSLLRSM
jgi:hypothetical protein